MKFNPHEDFNKNVSKLLALLRNMLKSQKIDNKEINDFFNKKDINLNLCFFTFLPYSLDDIDESVLDEAGEELMEAAAHESDGEALDLKFELSTTDLEFLKKNGITF